MPFVAALPLMIPSLVKIPELQENMFQLATEMERAGLVEEIVSDGLALTDVRWVLLDSPFFLFDSPVLLLELVEEILSGRLALSPLTGVGSSMMLFICVCVYVCVACRDLLRTTPLVLVLHIFCAVGARACFALLIATPTRPIPMPITPLQAEGLDAQADMEVDKVISELTEGLLEGAADAPTAVPEAAEAAAAPAAAADPEEEEKTNAMKARLESL